LLFILTSSQLPRQDTAEAVLKIQTKEKFLESDIILPMQSFQSLLVICFGTNGRNSEDGKDLKSLLHKRFLEQS
jgi:hypothetical protein